MLILFVTGTVSLVLVIISFGYLREFTTQYITKYTSRFILFIMGYRGNYPPVSSYPKRSVFYTFNHNSDLDVLLLTALGLPNTRFLLSERTWVYIPIAIMAIAMGTYYIPEKKHAKRRLKFFIRTTEKLKRNGLSFAGSSEGVHKHDHYIAPFNRGVYHMAMEVGLPVHCLFIYIPKQNNILYGRYAKAGTVSVETLARVDTSSWSLENLDEHIDHVRNLYVSRFNELNPNEPTT